MPTQAFGAYEAEETIATEVSSTYEGRHITLLASEINHGNVLAVVTKGYPVIFGTVAGNHGVGIALNTEVAGTDRIAIDTEGIWNVSVVASDDNGNSLVTGGDPLFINTTTAVVSKIRDNATQIPFGYALGQVAAAATAVIAVKVHWDPRAHWLEDQEKLYFGDLMDVSVEWDGANLEMLPLTNDVGALNIGNGTLSMDVQIFGAAANEHLLYDSSEGRLTVTCRFEDEAATGAGALVCNTHAAGTITGYLSSIQAAINIDDDATMNAHSWCGYFGVYEDAGLATSIGNSIAAINLETIIHSAPPMHCMIRLNTLQTGDTPDVFIYSRNPEAIAYTPNAIEGATKAGVIAIEITGAPSLPTGRGYLRVYNSQS